jgi:hypothetical protein
MKKQQPLFFWREKMGFVRDKDITPEAILVGGLLSAYSDYRYVGFSREKVRELLVEKAKKDIENIKEMKKVEVNLHEVVRLLREYASVWLYVAEKLEEEMKR